MLRRPCMACGLAAFRRNIVAGRGSMPAKLLFIGDAPGRSEDLTGQALVGPAGKLLDMLIADAGISCAYYVTDCLGCRPCDGKVCPDREPASHEVLACMPRVHTIVSKVAPTKIVLLGKVAAKYYRKEYRRALCIIHPIFLLRGGGKASPYYSMTLRSLKAYTEDLC